MEAADLASPLGVVARSGTPSPPIDLRVLTIGHAQQALPKVDTFFNRF